MERREILKGAGLMTLAALGGQALAAEHDHSHHDHAAHAAAGLHQAVLKAAGDCIQTGQACLAHCLILLGNGDKAMAGCAKSVSQMLALCSALQSLSNQQSRLTPALAKVALDACTECEKECRKHADKHAECKACADSCVDCIKACKAVAA